MKKSIVLLFSIFLLTSFSGINNDFKSTAQDTVYICSGPYAKKYHKTKKCRGLNNCSGVVKEIKLDIALRTKTSCNICYGN